MADITIAGSLIPSKVDTPLDKRARVATLADVANIENPVLGGIFYCIATGKHYKITALKNKVIGALTVANAQVDTYEEIPDAAALRGKADASDLSGFALADHTHDFGAMAEVTKLEVYATNEVITAGTVDSDTGLAYAVDVPAGMSHSFKLRSDTPQAKQDVSIDWGDGVISNLRSGDYDSLDDSEYAENGELVYTVSHTYATPGKYIVIISGKSYWGMQTLTTSSILSRIFAADLPVASWIKNLSNAAQYSPKLQKVMIPTGMDFFVNIHNASGMFQQCKNLLSVTNMATKFQYTRYVQNMFNGCEHMITCDFRIPQNCIKEVAYRCVYKGCAALTANIADLLPERGFDGTKLNFLECFRGCASLTGTVPASILWEDMRIVWTNTANVFTGCPEAIRSQVPVSWGGTASDVEDPHPITRKQAQTIIGTKVAEAVQNLPVSSGGNNGVGNILGGYTAKILTYEETTANGVTTNSLYLEPDLNNEIDWSKFEAGQTIRISLIESDNFIAAEIATVDSANSKLTLTESLTVPSNTTIGMEKRTVSGYTGSATGGLTAYRVTYSGAGSDDELFEGRTVYTRAGSGAFVSNSIAGTSGNYIYLSSAAAGTTAIYLAPSPAFVLVSVIDPEDTATASGEYNMVAGEASSAAGAYNRVTGIGNSAVGSENTVIGSNNYVIGEGNLALGFSISVAGNNNEIYDGNVFVTGHQNKAYKQGAVLIGDMNVALAVNTYAFGWGNQLKAHGVMGVGTRNTISGKWSVAVGYANKVGAETAYVVGRYADVSDAAENKNAFIVWGGEYQNNAEAFAVRSFRAEENPLFNSASLAPGSSLSDPNPKDSNGEKKYNSIPAYRTEYKGQLKPKTQTIAVSGTQTVTLDPTMYSRVMLTGSGTVTFDIESYAEDGDKIQLVFDSNGITPVFPASWVTLGADVSTTPGLYVLEVAVVGTTVFYKVLYPDSQGSGSGQQGASAYEVALANGFTGTEAQWLASLKGEKGDAVGIMVTVSSTAPSSPADGTIWIQP